MKIGILTFHFAHNSGAVLQTYALQESLKKLGHEVFVINYISPKMKEKQYKKYKIVPNNKNLLLKIKIQIVFRLIYNFFTIANRITKYEMFVKDNFNLTRNVTKDELKTLDFDAYILGSDQIWNEEITVGFDDAYFGAFIDKNKSKVISYAASLGRNKVENEEEFKKLLKNLDSISLRENDSIDFIKRYSDKNIVDTLDPTLLITRDEWEELFDLEYCSKPYVLFFNINKKCDEIKFAKEIAITKAVRLIVLEDYKKIGNFNLKMLVNTPYNFLKLIKNAEYVVTDSFHGIVFSIVFRKQFFVIKRESRFLRIQNLLDKLQIKGRIIGEEIQDIDYDMVETILEKEKEKSFEYLKKSLG